MNRALLADELIGTVKMFDAGVRHREAVSGPV